MAWTKRKLAEQAYGALGLTAFAFSLTPEMIASAVDTLDAMMASWGGPEYGIRIGYNGASDPSVTDGGSQDSGLPDHAYEAVYLGLGARLGSQIGKTLLPEAAIRKDAAFNALLSYAQSRNIPEMQFRRSTPAGAGNKPEQYVGAIFLQPVPQLTTGADGFIDGDDGTPFDTP
jgi:hypothetical protein